MSNSENQKKKSFELSFFESNKNLENTIVETNNSNSEFIN